MNRRKLIKSLVGLTATASIPISHKVQAKKQGLLLQESSVAGFQYYQDRVLWSQMKEGESLTLKREPQNKYDKRAVEVFWQNQKLGYVPRIDNAAVSQLIDRGEKLAVRISRLKQSTNPWEEIKMEVFLV